MVSLLMIASILKNSARLFEAGLVLSFLVFAALGFGQRLSHKFDEAALLFAYAALTFLLWQSCVNTRTKASS
jgi:hypothetical protein